MLLINARNMIKFLLIFFSFSSFAIVYEQNPELKSEIISKMTDFCQKANGIVAAFENSCGNSCIIYDRKTSEKLKILPSQCKEQKTYSCKCPENQCLQYGKCQPIKLI